MMKHGTKHTAGKRRWGLLPLDACREVVDVLEAGLVKYEPNNWQHVENARELYFEAIMRHLDLWRGGEIRDAESGRFHVAHVACCALFLVWFELHVPR